MFKIRARQHEVTKILEAVDGEYFDRNHFARELLNTCAGLLARRDSFVVVFKLPGADMAFCRGPYFTDREAKTKCAEIAGHGLTATVMRLHAPNRESDCPTCGHSLPLWHKDKDQWVARTGCYSPGCLCSEGSR